MRWLFPLFGFSILALSSCCTKVACEQVFESTAFYKFRPDEVDTVRVIIEDTEGNYPPDTLFTQTEVGRGPTEMAYITGSVPFMTRNRYHYYLPATGKTYVIDGYEFSREGCNSCFPSRPESDYYDVLRAYQVNGQRREGQSFVIEK